MRKQRGGDDAWQLTQYLAEIASGPTQFQHLDMHAHVPERDPLAQDVGAFQMPEVLATRWRLRRDSSS